MKAISCIAVLKKASKLDQIRTEREENSPCAQEDKHIRASSRVSAGSFIEECTLNTSFWPLGRVSKKKPHLTLANKQKMVDGLKNIKITHAKLLLWMGDSKFEMLWILFKYTVKVCNTAISASWEFADK